MLSNKDIQNKLSHYGITVSLPSSKEDLKEQIELAYSNMLKEQTMEAMIEHGLLVAKYEKEFGYEE